MTRRTFGGLLLSGGLSVAGFDAAGVGYAAVPSTPEPDGPDHLPRFRVKVLDSEISYVDVGEGAPVVFLHGNPTWSYQWRNVIPHVRSVGRCLAPDLLGMGWSGKSPRNSYRFVDHVRYMDGWFDALGLTKDVTLVVHDWGAPIGFYRARRYPGQIKAIAYYEAIVQPRRWEDFRSGQDALFRKLRSPEGETLVLDQNMFVEVVLPRGILRKLTDEEMEAYRAPYRDRDRRVPTLVWPRELPIDGAPPDVVAIVEENARWLSASQDMPKLFINGDPGASLTGRMRDFCRSFPNQSEITVKGLHHLQDDSPNEIGAAVRAFILSRRS